MATIECEWFTTEEKLHPDVPDGTRGHTICLVNRKGYGTTVLAWSHLHGVWDDEDMDDFCCEASDVSAWMALPEKFPPT